jgi:hypothetical protein
MSEEPEFIESEAGHIKSLSHLRILILMGLVAVAGSLYGFMYVSASFGWGVVIGGILSFVNYYWLKHSLHVVFEQAKRGERPAFAGSRYILRYFVFGLLLLFIYLTKTVSVAAVILGLASFAFAIVIEGFIRIFTSFIK